MASGNIPVLKISAQCLCKAHTFSATTPRSSLPLKGSCCHCTSCRHSTGALYTSDVPWPGSPNAVHNSTLRLYEFSPEVTVLFCPTCSTPMFIHEHRQNQDESLLVFTGTLANCRIPDLVSLTDHIFVGDTIDGGASPWLQHLQGSSSRPRLWRARQNTSEELSTPWPPKEVLKDIEDKTVPDVIPLQCHCKGINLVLRRGHVQFAAMDAGALPWFIDPTTHKHIASFDACNSCRSAFGVDIVNWTFALLSQLDFCNGGLARPGHGFPRTTQQLKDVVSRPNRDSRFGTLDMYESSADVQRYFCSRCSASVFYAVDDRQDLVDVAIGLLDAPEGARAERLLIWGLGSDVGGKCDVVGGWREGLVEVIKNDAESWRVWRGYPKTWRRVAIERAVNV